MRRFFTFFLTNKRLALYKLAILLLVLTGVNIANAQLVTSLSQPSPNWYVPGGGTTSLTLSIYDSRTTGASMAYTISAYADGEGVTLGSSVPSAGATSGDGTVMVSWTVSLSPGASATMDFDAVLSSASVAFIEVLGAAIDVLPASVSVVGSTIAANPDLSTDFGCNGANVLLILDESGSISYFGATTDVRNAAKDLIGEIADLSDNTANLGLITFGSIAQIDYPYTTLSTTNVSGMETFLDGSYNPGGSTNYGMAMALATTYSPAPDFIIFFSDGSPTTGGLVDYVNHSNTLKGNGSHLFAVGVGSVDTTTLFHLTDANASAEISAGGSPYEADFEISNFSALSDLFGALVAGDPAVDAGSNGTLPSGLTYDLATSSTTPSMDGDTLVWSSAGGGTFNDPNTLLPVYTPSLAEFVAGSATLTLAVTDFGVCLDSTETDIMTLTITADIPYYINDDIDTTDEEVPVTIDVLANDTTLVGTIDPTSVTVTSPPSNGSTSVNPDGTITYTPNPDFNGTDNFEYEVCDVTAAVCSTATVIVIVLPVADFPELEDDTDTTAEDTPTTTDVLANDNDPDGTMDPSSVTVDSGPSNGSTSVNPDGTITYTPDPDFNGTDTYDYIACDDEGNCDTATVTITVTDVNDPPIAIGDGDTTTEDTPVTTDVLDNDSDPDGTIVPSTVNVTTDPANGSTSVNPDGTITYTPDPDFNGTDTYTYEVCDNDGACDTAIVTITIGDVNDPPIAVDDTDITTEDNPVTTDVLGNDSDPDGTLDPSSVTVTTPPSNGSTSVNPDGTITYTPNPDFNGTDTYTYEVCDDDGNCDDATVTITIGDVNDPPIAVDDTDGTTEDTPVTTDVLNNDSDSDGTLDPTSVTVTTPPSNGSTSVNPDGSITYTPDPDFNGTDTYTYEVCDDDGNCDDATVTITIGDVNDPPIAVDDTDGTTEDTPVTTDVLNNDSDPDGTLDPTSVTVTTPPLNGSTSVNPDGTITYTPDPDFNGTDTYTYEVCDDDGNCDDATVTITVGDVNDPPIAVDDTDVTTEDTPVTTDVLNNDSDPDGTLDPSSVTVTSPPSNGSTSVNPDGTITYTPDPDFNGTDTYTYEVCDDDGNCDDATVTITIGDVNDPPIAVDDTDVTTEDTPVTTDVLNNDSDPDGTLDPSSVTVTSPPSNGSTSVNPDGTITYTPDPDFNGTDTYTYEVCDDDGNCDDATVTITIGDVNDPPIAVDDTDTTDEDTPVTTDVLDNDSDPDGTLDPSSVTVTSPPSNGSTSVNPDGTITYTPDPDFNGTDTYTYEVCDDDGNCDDATVTITIGDVNDPPIAVDDVAVTPEDTPITVCVPANDTDVDGDLDPTTVTIITASSDGTTSIDPVTGCITFTPNPGYNGTTCLTYQICDATGLCDQADLCIEVTPVNDAPAANDDATTLPEDSTVVIDVINNDSDPDGTLDPTSVVVVDGPDNGSTTVNPDGTVTYTPDPNYNGLDSFSYVICDTDVPTGCDTAWVIITVDPVNDPPVAVDDAAGTSEDTPVNIPVVLNDDDPLDPDGNIDPTTVVIVDDPNNGSATVNPDGTITYNPDADFNGMDTLVYVVCDDGNPLPPECDTAVVIITVGGVNDPPIAINDTTGVSVNTDIDVDILNNDIDTEAGLDPGSVIVLTDPTNGSTTVHPDGSVTYSPADDWCGVDSFEYQVCDNEGLCDDAWVFIVVACIDIVANDDAVNTNANVPVDVEILGNDSDNASNDCVTILELPENGTIEIHADGSITYTPFPGFFGEDCFIYEVCDTTGVISDDARVCITVDEIEIIIPEVFTPNGDGHNDNFEIVGLEQYPNNHIIIFNRWENEVYQTNGYSSSWEGIWQQNGERLPDGVYYYILTLDRDDVNSKVYNGFTTIYR